MIESTKKVSKKGVSPMMRHYLEVKEKNPDCLIFYRLGDFYELFFEDALTASKELDIMLTGRDCGMEERAPMCGVPHHSVEKYVARLIEKGYKVAICEQMEDPATAKGIVDRDIVRIVTPGTVLEASMLEEDKNNYILSLFLGTDKLGAAYTDISTGEFYVFELTGSPKELAVKFRNELYSIMPREIVYPAGYVGEEDFSLIKKECTGYYCTPYFDWCFVPKSALQKLEDHFQVKNLEGFGMEDMDAAAVAAGALMSYLYETQKSAVKQITSIRLKKQTEHMYLDTFTRRNLELCETLRSRSKRGSLLGLLDHTHTSMGSRMLRRWLTEPLLRFFDIQNRLDCVEEFVKKPDELETVERLLGGIRDIERITARITSATATPRELIVLRDTLEIIPLLKDAMRDFSCKGIRQLLEDMVDLSDVATLIRNVIADEPPLTIKEGGIIREGYSEELDRYRDAMKNGKNWILNIEREEKERTGIKNLKVGYNKVFGYYIDITNSYKDQVPPDYIRRQTLANSERYITPKLKEIEDMMLSSEERSYKLELEIFNMTRMEIADDAARLQKAANAIAAVDCFASLAHVALENNYVRPKLNNSNKIEIKNGRHPVIEAQSSRERFVPNDTYLDNADDKVAIITGPNMAGKSTYMRQVALICLMAQIGSFVPCDSCDLCILDRIFTRVGASDDISQGQSTFMVEMTEVASILHNATPNSLLIFDEIGRGTSTYDGLSIAWAVVEHTADVKRLGAKCLFATHYHELTELEEKLQGVKNYHVMTKEYKDEIVFLRKIVPGKAVHSYGIQVAKLAGVPEDVIERAKVLLVTLEQNDINRSRDKTAEEEPAETDETKKALLLMRELQSTQVDKITAIEALVFLDDLKKRYC